LTAYLLDVNVLLAMAWPQHSGHSAVQRWLAREGRKGWASCPFTQSGFVRIISNPAFSRDALSPEQALSLLHTNLEHPSHRFWPATLTVNEAMAKVAEIVGHQQITDAYLLGLAIHNKGRLATLDRRATSLLPRNGSGKSDIELIG
jgi:toxin-antitoxin system PIN domain toxin